MSCKKDNIQKLKDSGLFSKKDIAVYERDYDMLVNELAKDNAEKTSVIKNLKEKFSQAFEESNKLMLFKGFI